MANYHDLTMLFEAATDVFTAIIQREALSNVAINQWVRRDIGVPVLTMGWKAEDDIGRNLHISVIDEPNKVVAEIEVNAWQDIVQRVNKRGATKIIRRMINEGIDTLRHIEEHDRQWLLGELNAVLWQAYGVVSRIRQETLLQEPTRERREGDPGPIRRLSMQEPGEGDPGPIRVERWLGE